MRRNTITVCESPYKVSSTSPPNGDVPSHDASSSAKIQHNKVHSTGSSRLRRTGAVNKTHACANDVRQRLFQKLHGIEEMLEPSVEKRVHRAACKSFSSSRENLSENESSVSEKHMHRLNRKSLSSSQEKIAELVKRQVTKSLSSSKENISEKEDSPENDYVFDRSQGHRMPIPRRVFQQRVHKSQSADEIESKSQMLQRSESSSEMIREKPRPMVRARSACEIKPPVQIRTRVSQSVSVEKSDISPSAETVSGQRQRPKPAPRISKRASPVTVQQNETSSVLNAETDKKCDSPSESKSQDLTKDSQRSSSTLQRKQILVSARKSSSSLSSSPPSSSSTLSSSSRRHAKSHHRESSDKSSQNHLNKSSDEEQDEVQRRLKSLPDQPIEIVSTEGVQRRLRPQIVQRSQSHKFMRHSTDLSCLRAIPDNDSVSSPKSRGIMLGRQRKEAEELVKVNKSESTEHSLTVHKEESESMSNGSPASSRKLSELNVTELLHVSVGSSERVTNCPSPSINSDSDSAVST